jgi:hypothetical protein
VDFLLAPGTIEWVLGYSLLAWFCCSRQFAGRHVVQPEQMSDRIYTVLPGQFDGRLPQRLR